MPIELMFPVRVARQVLLFVPLTVVGCSGGSAASPGPTSTGGTETYGGAAGNVSSDEASGGFTTGGPTNGSGGEAPDQNVTGSGGASAGGTATNTMGGASTIGSGGSGSAVTSDAGSATGIVHVDNPFEGITGYVNPEWQAKANGEPGGNRISDTPTAVWLDRIASIAGTPDSESNGAMGLRDHLNAALSQGAGYIEFVIYDLPGRDCAALASNGELGPTDLPTYESDYIDPIAAIMSDPTYASLRIVTVIEPDSLPNLVTNTDVAECATMKANGNYVQGVAYALEKLGAIANVYNYLDAGHHGWVGWDSNFGPTADLLTQTARIAGLGTVQGFITNTANYSALVEPYFTAATTVNGTTVRQSTWVDWNTYVDELSFAQALRQKLVSEGFDSKIGMLIDTSRNGWGGPDRPTAASTSTDVDTFVNDSRIDRRIQAGNWCNQTGAGIGERPRADPADGVDAYVWIKPPGESDGSSTAIANSDGKGFDRMCDPTYDGNERNGNNPTGALANAPLAGAWFSAEFQTLMQNAYPPL